MKISKWEIIPTVFALAIIVAISFSFGASGQDMTRDVSPCIKDFIITGDTVIIGWTPPPCNVGVDVRVKSHHAILKHSWVKLKCGRIMIATWPDKIVPVVDTLTLKCPNEHKTDDE